MTILGIFLNSQIRTGGHRRYLELMEDLAARGHRVVVLLNEALHYEATRLTPLPLRARYMRGGLPTASQVFRGTCKKNLERIVEAAGNPDWILIHGETHLKAATFLKRRLGARLFFGSRSNVVRWSAISMEENRRKPLPWFEAFRDNLLHRWYEGRIARETDLVCFQSTFDRDEFLSRVRGVSAPTVVIGGNIGGKRFSDEYRLRNRAEKLRRLLFVGTLGERKGLRYLLKALALLKARGIEDIELDALGSGEALSSHSQFVEREGLSGRVHFHGRLPDPFPFYVKADLLVVPSLFDSYPDTVLEALHIGVPVIASRTGGIPDQLVYDELLFPIRDAEAIADRIETLYRDEDRYRACRALCSERRAAFDFDWAEAWETAMAERR